MDTDSEVCGAAVLSEGPVEDFDGLDSSISHTEPRSLL